MTLVDTKFLINEKKSSLGHYIFECDQLYDFINHHYIPNIIQLEMPRVYDNLKTKFLLVHGIEHEYDFQIFVYHSGTAKYACLKKVFELENFIKEKLVRIDDYKYKNLMFENYPVQTKMAPFLIANFDTRNLDRKFIKEYIDDFEKKEKESIVVYHYHTKYDVVANDGFIENKFSKTKRLSHNFICDIIFKLSYENNITMRIHFRNDDRKNEYIEFLCNDELIGKFRPININNKLLDIWRQDNETKNEYKKFVFPNRRRAAPYDEDDWDDEDD